MHFFKRVYLGVPDGFQNKKLLRDLVRQRTVSTERQSLVGEVSANFSG
jgi:hypothetical protein